MRLATPWMGIGRTFGTALAVAVVALVATTASASADVGFRDFSYGTGVTAPTGMKPQSKLWWTSGGHWWGVLWSTTANSWTIQKFNKATAPGRAPASRSTAG